MSVRPIASLGALAFAITSIAPVPIAAQTTQVEAKAKKTARAKSWSPALTPDGHPDLQGNWVNRSATPLEAFGGRRAGKWRETRSLTEKRAP
jgi:hypothetical protein